MSYPDDCGECRVCGCPVFGSLGVTTCTACEIPRDDKGRFMKRPEPPKFPENGDLVLVQEYGRRNGYNGYAVVLDDGRDDEFFTGKMVVKTDSGERHETHAGWLRVTGEVDVNGRMLCEFTSGPLER